MENEPNIRISIVYLSRNEGSAARVSILYLCSTMDLSLETLSLQFWLALPLVAKFVSNTEGYNTKKL